MSQLGPIDYAVISQALIASARGLNLTALVPAETRLIVPFFKGVSIELGLLYIALTYFVIVGTSNAVNLTDAIAILKMIVGLNVNSNNTALSPYQAIAADFDQSGDVGLTDAIGVLKMVVGLSAPTPTWKYYDDTKLASAYTAAQSLNPKGWTGSALISDPVSVDSGVKLIGVLTGDVDGSWTGT